VLRIDLGPFEAARARWPKRLPLVLAAEEVALARERVEPERERVVRERLEGENGAFPRIVRLLFGCGLRLMECCRLRVKDSELARGPIVVRGGKGNKDRVVMLLRCHA
jgi:site-specific recombinase XerD